MEEQKEKQLSLKEKFVLIRSELKVPKGQHNDFGNYSFRSCEDILEKIKPLESKYHVAIVLSDDVKYIPLTLSESLEILTDEVWDEDSKRVLKKERIEKGRFYIETTATLYDCDSDEKISNKASAREEDFKKGMDASQITGTASSYARKYALSGLFGLDDVKDADTNEYVKMTGTNLETNITYEEAEKYIFPGGKYKDKTLGWVYEKHPDYIDWLIDNNKANPTLKKCIDILDNLKTDDRLELLTEMKDLELKTDSLHEKILSKYGVKNDTELSVEQIKDAIETMKKYVPEEEKNKSIEVTPHDF